ncbi:MAG: hypothetical protein FWF08_03560 [Oscillospiraceae bacterium]|nr:hypothetical protein [Oscillospiraceae bacterium]
MKKFTAALLSVIMMVSVFSAGFSASAVDAITPFGNLTEGLDMTPEGIVDAFTAPIRNVSAYDLANPVYAISKVIIGYLGVIVKGFITGLLNIFPFPESWVSLAKYNELSDADKNFMPGSETFADSATGDKWMAGYAITSLVPDDLASGNYVMAGDIGTSVVATEVAEGDDQTFSVMALSADGGQTVALFCAIDSFGFTGINVKKVRGYILEAVGGLIDGEIISINISASHTHYSCLDYHGLGVSLTDLLLFNFMNMFSAKAPTFEQINPKLLEILFERGSAAAVEAVQNMQAGDLEYNKVFAEDLMHDKQIPIVFDKNINQIRFVPDNADANEIWIVNMGVHPTTMERKGTVISAEYPGGIRKYAKELAGADVVFIQGVQAAITKNYDGLRKTDWADKFEEVNVYGEEVVLRILDYMESPETTAVGIEPILNIRHIEAFVPTDNPIMWATGKLQLANNRMVFADERPLMQNGMAVTEVGYAELGKELAIAMMPGEIYPEVVYGGAKPAKDAWNNVDWPYKAFNKIGRAADMDHLIAFGITNDQIGYVIPDNDYAVPLADTFSGLLGDLFGLGGHALGDDNKHYEELLSLGSKAASTLAKAFIAMVEGI